MKKSIVIITSLISVFYCNGALAQNDLKNMEAKDIKRDTRTFNIVSLNGKNKKVIIIPDYVKRILRIICMKDTIGIDNFWGVPPEFHLLNKSFIEIKYEVRGGSNLGLGNTLILCVNDNKLYEALHVLRYTSWDSGDLKTDYHINFKLNEDSKSNYKLNMRIHDDVKSKPHQETNYIYNSQTFLHFDKKKNVFYSIKEDLNDNFIYSNTARTVKQNVKGNFPVVILGKETYYFINSRWYQSEINNEMCEFER